jgi:hypothetical protein
VLQAIPTYMFSALIAPQTIIKSIRNLQRNFLWHGHKQGKKWALVGWEKICKPTSMGGLGLRDPGNLNNVMGEKIWWRWLKHPEELWAQLWRKKYTPQTLQEQLIRLEEQIQGSNIWNAAWRNHPLIQKHAFWEIQNGHLAHFWTDAWQQQPPLQSLENISLYQNQLPDLEHLKVADLWLTSTGHSPWRSWKLLAWELNLPENIDMLPWKETVGNMKIHISEEKDILRWGNSPIGTFTIKEAYQLHENFHQQGKITFGT